MNDNKKLKMFEDMYRIRLFEEKVSEMFSKGELKGSFHLYLGEEAIAVGTCAALEESDYITSTHRGHGHVLAKGARSDLMMAEMYAKSTGYCKGKGGSMHIAVPELGILGANGIVGAGIPIATGAGLSSKLQKNGKVVISFFGEGASNQGTFHESINIASAFKLPVVFVCENNLYGVGTKQRNVRNIEDIKDRALAYGIEGLAVDGNDVEAVFESARKAVKKARSGEGPTLIEYKTYRWHTHFEGEPDTYRPKEEVREWREKDPIVRYRKVLSRTIDENVLAEIEKKVRDEIDTAVRFAKESPVPSVESALEGVYA